MVREMEILFLWVPVYCGSAQPICFSRKSLKMEHFLIENGEIHNLISYIYCQFTFDVIFKDFLVSYLWVFFSLIRLLVNWRT